MLKNRIKFFQSFPWNYGQGVVFSLFLIIAGFFIQWALPGNFSVSLHFPFNLLLLLILINIIFLLDNYLGKKPFVSWLRSVPGAVSAMFCIVFLLLLMVLIPQKNTHVTPFIMQTGLSAISSGVPFFISQLFFLTSLGLVILKRKKPLKGKNIWFVMNHTGMWVIIAAALAGSGDIKRFRMDIEKNGKFTNRVFDSEGKIYDFPFRIKLLDFKLEEYPPKILVLSENGKILYKRNSTTENISKGSILLLKPWTVRILDYLSTAVPADSVFRFENRASSAPAALVAIQNLETGKMITGWLTGGSFLFPAKKIQMDHDHFLCMMKPEPMNYISVIAIENLGKTDTMIIRVNRPIKVSGWRIYLSGYDKQLGKWSQTNLIEFVRDPWIFMVYAGFFMVMAGALYIFWNVKFY